MKKIVSGADTIINLAITDNNGDVIELSNPEIVSQIEIKVYTKGTPNENKIVRNTLEELTDNHIKLQAEELDGLQRGQVLIDVYIVFFCEEFTDGKFDYRKKISTNLILV